MPAATVEDHAWAHIVTDAPHDSPVEVVLCYEPTEDPRAVRFSFPSAFPSGRDWTFPREVLESGLRTPVRSGDIEVWPCGRVQAVVEFHTPEGVAVVQFDTSVLSRFLRHTYAASRSAPQAAERPVAAPPPPPG
ncbi:SsgA family sporulation/cell division regulator [Streptomyces sp. NPDC055078]